MILVVDNCGLCKGYTSFLNTLYDIYEREIKKDNGKKIYIYKELVKNNEVIKEITDLGIDIIDNINEVTSNDIIFLNCHGTNIKIINYLKENNIEFYDMACPKIKKAEEEIVTKFKDGYEIILLGEKNSFEIDCFNSLINNEGLIVNDEIDFAKISNNQHKYVVISPSLDTNLKTILISKIQAKFLNSEVIINDICRTESNIILNSIDASKNINFAFVVGDETKMSDKLYYELSRKVKTYRFNNKEDFSNFIMQNDFAKDENFLITGSIEVPIKEIYNYKYLLAFLLFYKEKLTIFKNNQHLINDKLLNEDDHDFVKNVVKSFIDLNEGGKYIRGTLIALGFYLSGNTSNDYLDLSLSYETFQSAILIHDDIIDNAKLRRGKETIPRRICQKYLNLANAKTYQNDVLKLANSLAICAGDLGFFNVNKLLINSYQNNPNLVKLLDFYNDIVIKTIKGEIIDVYLPFTSKYDLKNTLEEDIIQIYHLKTSWYTIIGPFILGYILGGKDKDEDIINVLNKIGLAFQIKDDLLGIFGSSEEIGKSNTSDIKEFKQTILYSYIINTPYKEEFLKIYGNSYLDEIDITNLKNLLMLSGAYDYANDYLDELYGECLESIDELNINVEGKDILKGLLIYIILRNK